MKKKSSVFQKVTKLVPLLGWIPTYDVKENLLSDIIGGLTVGFIHVPQGMAYASLAGLQPVYGLYTSLVPALVYMIFGTSRHISLGVFAVVSLMTGSCNIRVTEEILSANNTGIPVEDSLGVSVEVVKSLGLLVGIFQILLGIVKANYLIAFLSDQIIYGFTTGAAVHVFTAQLNKILGVSLPRYSGFGRLFKSLYELCLSIYENKQNNATVVISLVTIIMLYSLKYHVTPNLCGKTRIPIPYDLFVIIFGTIFSMFTHLNEKYHVKIIGKIPTGLPKPHLPDVSLFEYFVSDALAIAIVSIVVTISMGKVFAKKHKYEIDVQQEFFALGIMESVSSMFPCWPSSTALARSIINDNAGSKTQLSAIFSALVLILVLFFIGPLLEKLPICFLSCIVIVALRGMFLQLNNFCFLWKISKIDWAIFSITFFATVIYDVVPGLFIGSLSAICFAIFQIQRVSPIVEEDDGVANNGNTLRLFYASSLLYFNCDIFERNVVQIIQNHFEGFLSEKNEQEEHLQLKENSDKIVILDMKGVSNIDLSGINLLIKIRRDFMLKDIQFFIINPTSNLKEVLKNVKGTEQLLQF